MILEIYMKITTLDTVRHYLLTFEGTSVTQTHRNITVSIVGSKHELSVQLCYFPRRSHCGRNADTQV